MQTLTPQGIADLAQVKRPVVSVWRSRYSSRTSSRAPHPPFPEPLPGGSPQRFEASEVAAWLATTGLGNNPAAGLEAPLHSDAMDRLTSKLDEASALLLLHALTGEPVADRDRSELLAEVDDRHLSTVLDVDTVARALDDRALCQAADELAEAAFSARSVLERLTARLSSAEGPWAAAALTHEGEALLAGVLAELQRAALGRIRPLGPGAAPLMDRLVGRLEEHERLTLALDPEAHRSPANRVAWRLLAAHSCDVVLFQPGLQPADGPTLHVLAWQSAAREGQLPQLSAAVEEALVALPPGDVLVVLGPASLMTDRPGQPARARLLASAKGYAAPLRYVTRLPRGLSRHGGRERLALWVFGNPTSEWTVVGAHPDARLDSAAAAAIAADVTTSVSSTDQLVSHAFRSSSLRRTMNLVRLPELVAPAAAPELPQSGGERLAAVWGLRDALEVPATPCDPLAGIELGASEAPSPAPIALPDAAGRLADDLPGVRLPAELIGLPATGSAFIIGPDEVREQSALDARAIDRLALERIAPHAQLTEPGDVVYVASGGAAAIVDRNGGHVVLAPARVLRPLPEPRRGRQLVSALMAIDIATQAGTDRRTWQLRSISSTQAGAATTIAGAIADRRDHLRRQLSALDDLERELLGGLADDALIATTNGRASPPSTSAKNVNP